MRDIKFRAWHRSAKEIIFPKKQWHLFAWDEDEKQPIIIMQYIGLKDIEEKEFYHYDIAEFPNGDRFIILQEDWLEFYVEWIGEPECEDQARDLYRISKAKIIGNKFENPELLKDNQ